MQTIAAPLDQLKLDPHNANEHNAENMAAIADSLRKFGQVEPLVVQESTGMVIGGNGRLVVMRQMKWPTAFVNPLDITDDDAMELGIVLNRSSELSKRNVKQLTENLARLAHVAGGDLAKACIGYDASDIRQRLDAISAPPRPPPSEGDGTEGAAALTPQALLYSLSIDFETEAEQMQWRDQLEADGLSCRLSIAPKPAR